MKKIVLILILLGIMFSASTCVYAFKIPDMLICVPTAEIAQQVAEIAVNAVLPGFEINDYEVKIVFFEETDEWLVGFLSKKPYSWLKENEPLMDLRNVYLEAGYEMHQSMYDILVIINRNTMEISYLGPS